MERLMDPCKPSLNSSPEMSSFDNDSRIAKRFNLKLPPTARQLFLEPYDAYLGYLLELTFGLNEFDPYVEQKLKDYPLFAGGGSSNRWTLWVSKDIRQLFDQQKAILAPSKTHGTFVEMLLTYKQILESQGLLRPFVYTNKKTFLDTKSETQEVSSSNQSGFPVMSPFSPFTPITPQTFQFPEFGHFNSQMTLSSELGSSVDMLQDPNMLPNFDSFGNLFHDILPVCSSDTYTLTHNTDADLVRPRVDVPFEQNKKTRYSYSKTPRLIAPRIVTNLNSDFDSLHLFSPVSCQADLPSPDVLKATDLATINATTTFGETFVLNDIENYINFNYGQ